MPKKAETLQMTKMVEIQQMTDAQLEQVAHQVSGLLDVHARGLSDDKVARLSEARKLAVAQHQSSQAQSLQHSGGVLHWLGSHLGDYFGQHRAMSTAMIAGAMMVTFFVAQLFMAQFANFNNNLENSDAFLLASDLPPEAYADKGFDTWLDSEVRY